MDKSILNQINFFVKMLLDILLFELLITPTIVITESFTFQIATSSETYLLQFGIFNDFNTQREITLTVYLTLMYPELFENLL